MHVVGVSCLDTPLALADVRGAMVPFVVPPDQARGPPGFEVGDVRRLRTIRDAPLGSVPEVTAGRLGADRRRLPDPEGALRERLLRVHLERAVRTRIAEHIVSVALNRVDRGGLP